MNNTKKKAMPTLVGGALLLSSSAVHAVENSTNKNESQLLENDSIEKESGDVIIKVDGEISNSDSENIEIAVDSDKEIIIDSNTEIKDETINKEESVEVENVISDVVPEMENSKEIINNQVVNEEVKHEEVKHEEVRNLSEKEKTNSEQKVMKIKVSSASVRADVDKNSEVKGTLTKNAYVDVYAQDSKEGWSKINFKGEMAYINTSDLTDVEVIYKEVNKSSITVKSGAGDTYGDFGTLSKGDRVKVYQELDNGWSKVDYNSKIAFIKTTDLDDSYISKAIVKTEKINVYKDSSDSSNILGECKKNETLFIYQEINGYYKVKFSDGYGYVKKSDLSIIENSEKPQTGDMMVFSYMGAMGVSSLGFVAVNRKNKNNN